MTTVAILALIALAAAMVLFAVRGSARSRRRIAAGDGGYVYVDGGAGSDCSSGSDGGGCGGDGGGGGD